MNFDSAERQKDDFKSKIKQLGIEVVFEDQGQENGINDILNRLVLAVNELEHESGIFKHSANVIENFNATENIEDQKPTREKRINSGIDKVDKCFRKRAGN